MLSFHARLCALQPLSEVNRPDTRPFKRKRPLGGNRGALFLQPHRRGVTRYRTNWTFVMCHRPLRDAIGGL